MSRPPARFHRRNLLRWLAERHLLAWGVLLVGLGLTTSLWLLSSSMVREMMQERFRFREAEVVHAVRDRIQAYEQVLHGARGLMRAANPVSRSEWRIYVGSLDLPNRYPGIQGVGFARWTRPDDLDAQEAPRESLEGFTVRRGRKRGSRR